MGSGGAGMKFSANLGFLWQDRQLPDAVAAAAEAGFDAVEFHWPQGVPAAVLKAALDAAGLPALGVNTSRGGEGRFGLGAVPGAEKEALAAFDEALDYAVAIGAGAIHAMAGVSADSEAEAVFESFLQAAAPKAETAGITILIEPINRRDMPGYVLHTPDQAARLIGAVSNPCIRMMYDCYHAGTSGRDVVDDLRRFMPLIGHIQIAGVPGRAEPDKGDLDYLPILAHIESMGYGGFIGAEYKPEQGTEEGLGWLSRFSSV